MILGFQAYNKHLVDDEGDESLKILQQRSTKTDDLELFASVLTEAITSATKASIPLKKLSNRAKPWWSSELKELRQEITRAQRLLSLGEPNSTLAYVRARNIYFLAIKRAKRDHWNQFLEKEDSKSIFKALAYTKSRKVEKLPPIRSNSGLLQDSFQGRCKALKDTLFPTLPTTESPSWDRYTASRAWDWPILSKVELVNACSAKIKGKTPGPDSITQELILKSYEAIPEVFYSLYSRLIDIGYHPKYWRQAIGAILKLSLIHI